MESEPLTVTTFDCPVHGMEIGAHCFRAFDPANRDRWRMYGLAAGRLLTDDEYKVIRRYAEEQPR